MMSEAGHGGNHTLHQFCVPFLPVKAKDFFPCVFLHRREKISFDMKTKHGDFWTDNRAEIEVSRPFQKNNINVLESDIRCFTCHRNTEAAKYEECSCSLPAKFGNNCFVVLFSRKRTCHSALYFFWKKCNSNRNINSSFLRHSCYNVVAVSAKRYYVPGTCTRAWLLWQNSYHPTAGGASGTRFTIHSCKISWAPTHALPKAKNLTTWEEKYKERIKKGSQVVQNTIRLVWKVSSPWYPCCQCNQRWNPITAIH